MSYIRSLPGRQLFQRRIRQPRQVMLGCLPWQYLFRCHVSHEIRASFLMLAGSWGFAPWRRLHCMVFTPRINSRGNSGVPCGCRITGSTRRESPGTTGRSCRSPEYLSWGAPGSALTARSCTGFRAGRQQRMHDPPHLTGGTGCRPAAVLISRVPAAAGYRGCCWRSGKRVSSSAGTPSLPAIRVIMSVLGCLRPPRMARM